jgi:hypothetical protein
LGAAGQAADHPGAGVQVAAGLGDDTVADARGRDHCRGDIRQLGRHGGVGRCLCARGVHPAAVDAGLGGGRVDRRIGRLLLRVTTTGERPYETTDHHDIG